MADRLKSAFHSEKLALVPLFRNKKAYFTMLVCYDRVLYVVFHVSFLSALTISCLIATQLTIRMITHYSSCSPFRVPIARLAAAQAAVEDEA